MKAKSTPFFIAVAMLTGITVAKAQTASIQVIHNCSDAAAGTVDIYAGTSLLVNDLQFRHSSQTFTNIPASSVLTIGVAPGTSTSSSQSIATFTVNFAPNTTNIIVADGIVSSTGYNPSNMTAPFSLKVYTAGISAAPNATTTSLLIHHGSTDAPIVDVVAPFSGTNPVIPNALVNNAAYGDFSSYLNLPTANYQIQIRDQFSENVVAEYVAPLSTLNLGGAALTVIASGFLNPANNSNGPAFGLFVASPAAGSLIPLPTSTITSTRLQAIHNCADAAASQVDVWFKSSATGASDILLVDNFSFRSATPFIEVPTGQTITLSIAAPNSTSAASPITSFTYNLSPNNKYQLIASGIVSPSGYTPGSGTVPFNLIVNTSVRERALTSTNTDVLVFHGVTDAPSVGVSAEGSGPVVSNLSYPNYNSAGYLQLPSNTSAGNYTLHVTDAAITTTIASYQAPLNTLALSGQAITVLASGFLNTANNSNGPAFGLWVALPTGGNLVPLPALTPTITGLSNLESLNNLINVYPNPFSEKLTLMNEATSGIQMELFSLEGRKLLSATVDAVQTEFITNELPQGIYILKVSDSKSTFNTKLIKN